MTIFVKEKEAEIKAKLEEEKERIKQENIRIITNEVVDLEKKIEEALVIQQHERDLMQKELIQQARVAINSLKVLEKFYLKSLL